MATEFHETSDDGGDEPPTQAQPRPEGGRGRVSGLPLDRVFDVLRNERRRAVLRYLDTEGFPVDVGAVAEHVASLENDKPAELLDSLERKRVYVALYQYHLPKMAEYSVIEFAKNRGRIAPGPAFEQVLSPLDAQPAEQDDWPYCYLLSGLGLLAVTVLVGLGGTATMATAAAMGGMLLLSLYGTANWLEHVVAARRPLPGGH